MKEGGTFDEFRQYPLWARGPARIIGDEITLDEDRAEEYSLDLTADSSDIVMELCHAAADWENRDSRDALAFVRRNGLFWHGAKDLGTGECRESLSEWWEEARRILLLTSMYNGLARSVDTGTPPPHLRQCLDELGEFYGGSPDHEIEDSELPEVASIVLAEAVTERLETCGLGITSSISLSLKISQPDYFLLAVNPPDLLTSVYVALSGIVVNHAPMKECPGCGRTFVQESGKQKYCSKSCASTSRWRRWDEKRRGK